jgi:hypothetical protein
VTGLARSRSVRWKEDYMEDFPIWLKMVIWLVIGGTVAYAIGAVVFTAMLGGN